LGSVGSGRARYLCVGGAGCTVAVSLRCCCWRRRVGHVRSAVGRRCQAGLARGAQPQPVTRAWLRRLVALGPGPVGWGLLGFGAELVSSLGLRLGAGAGRGDGQVAGGLKERGLRDADLLASWVVGDRRIVGSLVTAGRQGRVGSRGFVGPGAGAGSLSCVGGAVGNLSVAGSRRRFLLEPDAGSGDRRTVGSPFAGGRQGRARREVSLGPVRELGGRAGPFSGAVWCCRLAGLNGSRWAWCGGRRLGPAWSWLGRGCVVVAAWLSVPVSAAVSRWGAGALARARWFAVGRALLEAPDQGGQR
jgi:hypothetical protein